MVEEACFFRNRVFQEKYFVQTLNKGKKPGFFGAVRKSCFSVTGDGRGGAIGLCYGDGRGKRSESFSFSISMDMH
jgi:hypothetical protein